MVFNLENRHNSWDEFFTAERILQVENIYKKLQEEGEFVPLEENVFRFTNVDIGKIRIIFNGQDPYSSCYCDKSTGKKEPVANGRSFQPNCLDSWGDSFSQKSLQNIIRLIYKNYNQIESYDDIKTFVEIRNEINKGEFNILPPKEWFDSLESQGVLFLNTYLTTKPGKGNAHKLIWKSFSKDLIQYIAMKNPKAYWFLWGAESKKLEDIVCGGTIYKSNHPTFCSSKNENDFLKSNCFKDTMDVINWLGVKK